MSPVLCLLTIALYVVCAAGIEPTCICFQSSGSTNEPRPDICRDSLNRGRYPQWIAYSTLLPGLALEPMTGVAPASSSITFLVVRSHGGYMGIVWYTTGVSIPTILG